MVASPRDTNPRLLRWETGECLHMEEDPTYISCTWSLRPTGGGRDIRQRILEYLERTAKFHHCSMLPKNPSVERIYRISRDTSAVQMVTLCENFKVHFFLKALNILCLKKYLANDIQLSLRSILLNSLCNVLYMY